MRRAGLAAGAVLVGAMLLAAAASLVWTPYDTAALDVAGRLEGPTPAHWLGTDHLGRDIGSLLVAGARTSVVVGLVAVGIGLVAGVGIGLVAAVAGGAVDDALMRACDLVFAFPAIITALLVTALAGPGAVNAILAIALFNVPVFARLARSVGRQIGVRDYVRAAQALGRGPFAIARHHLLPNIAGVVVVQAALQFGIAILAEAGLSYLGIGTPPPEPSWGRMLSDSQTYLFSEPMLAVYPGLAISLAVLGCNLLGDGLRDALDPRLRSVVGVRQVTG